MDSRVRAGINKSEADPLWDEAADLVLNVTLDTESGRRLVTSCWNGSVQEYAAAACGNGTLGSNLINGIPVAAHFCGSVNSGINWTREWWGNYSAPVTQICNATPGTAYNATGFCGRWTLKELVLGTFLILPFWQVDPVFMNIASLNCILGLGDCDIHYCQTCPGICGPE